MSAWIEFLGNFYRDKKKTNPNYTYKNAMKDGAKTYRNHKPHHNKKKHIKKGTKKHRRHR
jgi:hypothetical protein